MFNSFRQLFRYYSGQLFLDHLKIFVCDGVHSQASYEMTVVSNVACEYLSDNSSYSTDSIDSKGVNKVKL